LKVAVYCRVSTTQQELEAQLAACERYCTFKQFDVVKVYSEKISSVKARPEYDKLLHDLRAGLYDGVVVFRIDRLGRRARDLSLTVDELENRGIKVLSVSENFDTSTPIGRAMREIIFIMAQLERENIGDATKQRLAAVKASGKRLGQKPLSDYQVDKVRELAAQGLNCRKIAKQMNLSKSIAYNIVHQKGYYSTESENVQI
jgi:DNA invertase Pin-like site-specific DNA recombinase